jgi:DNA-binding XRE family transcriptional regulator
MGEGVGSRGKRSKANDPKFGVMMTMARDKAGLTREELAAMTGFSSSTLQGIEAGDHYPSLPLFAIMTVVLNLDAEDILDYLSTKHFTAMSDVYARVNQVLERNRKDQATGRVGKIKAPVKKLTQDDDAGAGSDVDDIAIARLGVHGNR